MVTRFRGKTGNCREMVTEEEKLWTNRLRNSDTTNNSLVELLEKQKKDLVIRVLKKHEELQAGKEFTNKILTSLSELFFLLDKDYFVVQSNKEFSHCLGYSPDKRQAPAP